MSRIPKLREKYNKIVPVLMKKFNYKNIMQVPRVIKVVINVGAGEAIETPKFLDTCIEELAAISGQRPVITRAKKSIAAFKIRKGVSVGCKVTLRSTRMYEFLYKLINVGFPRIRDFRGLSPKSFDGKGNYTFGIKEQVIFPEIDFDKVLSIHGMDITIATTAKKDEEAKELLFLLGVLFR